MLIGELADRAGVSRRQLRYYEAQGLLVSGRDPNGYRRYRGDAVTTVRQIRVLLAAGLSTDVIRSVLPCAVGDAADLELCPEVVGTLRDELASLDGRIAALQRSRGRLASYLA